MKYFAELILLSTITLSGSFAFAKSAKVPTKYASKQQSAVDKKDSKNKNVVCSTQSAYSALIVIDMQPYFAIRGGQHNEPENKEKIEKVIEVQIASIKKAIAAGIPIVFLEYECPPCDPTDSRLKAAVSGYKNVRFIKKTTDGMLDSDNKYRKELADFLNKNNIGTLIITGANGGACVLESITGALENNCNVVAYNAGIADFNYKDFIYPYIGQYTEIKPNCKDCTFKEVFSIDKMAKLMVKSTYSSQSSYGTQQSSKSAIGVR